MRRRWLALVLVGAALIAVYVANASWLAPEPTGTPGVLAHRGVHQTFRREGVTNNTCTAALMNPPTNPHLENTVPSIAASFAAGASAVEVDVHPTTDGEFAVFHDWTLDCRTDGRGVTRERPMSYLRTLDVGHGYTADGGRTFPFRGRGVGLMPTLHEVLAAFPGRTVLINVKSGDPTEADRLVAYLRARGHPTDHRLWVFAARGAHVRLRTLAPRARVDAKARMKRCAIRYLLLGWSGYVPDACRGASVGVPVNLRWAYWGWPNRFLHRMERAGAQVMLVGPIGHDEPMVSEPAQLDAVPAGFSGLIATDHVERIGREVRRRWPTR